MNWLHYLLEANLYLAVFYAGYYLFLSRETYYTLNRVYLLFSCVASFALPVIQLGALKPIEQPITAVRLAFVTSTVQFVPAHTAIAAPVFSWQDAVVYAYVLGAMVLLLILLIKLYQLYKLTRVRNLGSDANYKVVYINQSDTAFSFFNYLFIGTKVREAEIIIKHELVHIRQKHSADIIFTELLKIVNWFNPFIYLLQYSLREIHEFIADEKTAAFETDTLAYSSFLVDNAYGLGGSSITHSFFNYNLLKKRIIMLHQKRSGNLARLKYLLAIPICGALLCASTLAFSKTYGWVDIAPHATDLPHRINPANKSPQVPEPVRRILLTKNGISTITDQFTATRSNGTNRTYTVRNLTNKDVVDLKKQGIIVSIISDVKIDSGKLQVPPPPPPAPPIKRVKFPLPKPLHNKTAKGYLYSEASYVDNDKQDIVVTFQEKDGSHKEFTKSKATAAELALLKDKYGYVFPAHLKMPPPPPAPPVQKLTTVRLLPPPPAPPKPSVDNRPPPPPPHNPFDTLYRYISKAIRYPKNARLNHIAGREIVRFTVTDGKIDNLKMLRGLDADIDAEILSVIKKFNAPINTKSANYVLPISFALQDINGDMVGNSPNVNAASKKTEKTVTKTDKDMTMYYSLNELVVTGYEIK